MSAFAPRFCGSTRLALMLGASPRSGLFAANMVDPARGVDRQVDYAHSAAPVRGMIAITNCRQTTT